MNEESYLYDTITLLPPILLLPASNYPHTLLHLSTRHTCVWAHQLYSVEPPGVVSHEQFSTTTLVKQ